MIAHSSGPRADRMGGIVEGAGLLAWVSALAIAATSSAPLRYDEPFYLAPVASFQQHGLSFALLANYPEVTGIVHTAIQWLAAPLTGLTRPGVRVVNSCVMAVALLLVARLLATVAPGAARFALRLMALPPVWIITGMALTEPPAIALLAAALWLFYQSRHCRPATAAVLAAGAGLMFAGAVLAKQSVLPVIGGIIWLGWAKRAWLPRAIAFAAVAAVLLLPVFVAWRGLAPPIANALQKGFFSPSHAVMALGYAGGFCVIVAPAFFAVSLRRTLPYAGAVFVLNAAVGLIQMRPLASIASHVVPAALLPAFDRVAGGIVLAAATFFVATLICRWSEHRDDEVWTSAAISLLLCLGSLGAVTYSFSGRYVAILSPLLLVVVLPYRRFDVVSSVVLLAGYAAGAISLLSYLPA